MAIDVVIKQKLFGSKTMPLEVILGERLCYGNFVKDRLRVDELGEEEFVAFNPESIGRGFSVIWNPNEKKTITLRLPIPSTTLELNDFYAAVERMVTYWGATLIVDGSRVKLEDFLLGLNDMVDFNDRTIKRISQEILDGEHDTLTLYSAIWPLSIGKEEAAQFVRAPERYAAWLDEKQSMAVQFASPSFFMSDDGIVGRYVLINGYSLAFPLQPFVPFGFTDAETGMPIECNEWSVLIALQGEDEPLCEMEYAEFLKAVPESKKSYYDASRFLLAEMTEEDIRSLCDSAR